MFVHCFSLGALFKGHLFRRWAGSDIQLAWKVFKIRTSLGFLLCSLDFPVVFAVCLCFFTFAFACLPSPRSCPGEVVAFFFLLFAFAVCSQCVLNVF